MTLADFQELIIWALTGGVFLGLIVGALVVFFGKR